VERVRICEIDEEVVHVCRKYFPDLASSFDDPKVEITYGDGAKYVSEQENAYDVIIVDSTDPLGPGKILFQRPFYEDMKKALAPDGIAVTQCESIYLHRNVIRGVYAFARHLYPKVGYYLTLVPTYPSGTIGFLFCSLKWDPVRDLRQERADALSALRYYTPSLHRASFALPRFAETLFQEEV
jgi:spermidine synthase